MRAESLFSLSGQTAMVTGASSGLGARFARVLAANGAATLCLARRRSRLEHLVAQIEADGGKAMAIEADVSDRSSMERAFAQGEAAFGPVQNAFNVASEKAVANQDTPNSLSVNYVWELPFFADSHGVPPTINCSGR